MTRNDTRAHSRRALGISMALTICLAALPTNAQEKETENREVGQSDGWEPYMAPDYQPDGRLRKSNQPRLPYHEGMPVPDGYHLESTPRYGLIATGVSMTASLWLVSTVSAIVLDKEASDDGDPNFDDMYWPMFIPVAGPFATIATADSSGTGAAILALDGTVQAVGLAMAIAGFAAPTVELVPDYEITVAPVASGEEGGFSISGSF